MSKEDIWALLNSKRIRQPTYFGPSLHDESKIENVERTLSVKFSDSYLNFLREYNYAFLSSYIIYGIDPVDGDTSSTVLENTLFYKEKQKWPDIEDWYIISDDGFGNPIGVDPEGKVWLSDHDCGFEKVLLADSFEEFLYKLYTDTLYE